MNEEAKAANVRFTIGDKAYALHYTIQRVDMYEDTHGSIGGAIATGVGLFLKHSELRDLIAYGLREDGGDYVNPADGARIADKLIEKNGYVDCLAYALSALKRDCAFLFMESTV